MRHLHRAQEIVVGPVPKGNARHRGVRYPTVMPAEAGIQPFLPDSRQKRAGMTTRGYGHFISWSFTKNVTRGLSSLLLLVALVLFAGSVAHSDGPPQVTTLNELITRFDGSSCKECHEQIYSQWEKSHHARPLMGLNDQIFMTGYLKNGPLAIKPGEKATRKNFPCFKCHLPQIEYTTDAVAAEIAEAILKDDKTTLRKLNISCLVCHNEKAVVHGRPEPNVLYGNKDIPDHQGLVVKKSPLLKDSLMCGQCHGLGPNLEFETPVQCATLYGSYLHAYIPSGGTETCQECHMKEGHLMPPDFNRRDELSERLRASLPMEVHTLAYSFQPKEEDVRPMAVVKTRITSKAGHRIPDG